MAFIPQMSEELKAKVVNLTPFQKNYCEFRSKGFSQAISAQKAGSNAKDTANLGRTGFQVETMDGVKDYIIYLKAMRAQVSIIDHTEVIKMIKQVYDKSMDMDKFKEANDAAKLLGQALGLFDTKNNGNATKTATLPSEITKNNTDAFREEGDVDDNQTSERIEALQKMIKDLNR